MAEITGVEIMRAGTWNGDRFTLDHLKAMADAFLKQDFDVPLKLGHTHEPDSPAYGWVKNVRVIGQKLVADFTDIPDKIFEMIRAKMFNNVSVEIFFNFKRGGKNSIACFLRSRSWARRSPPYRSSSPWPSPSKSRKVPSGK